MILYTSECNENSPAVIMVTVDGAQKEYHNDGNDKDHHNDADDGEAAADAAVDDDDDDPTPQTLNR